MVTLAMCCLALVVPSAAWLAPVVKPHSLRPRTVLRARLLCFLATLYVASVAAQPAAYDDQPKTVEQLAKLIYEKKSFKTTVSVNAERNGAKSISTNELTESPLALMMGDNGSDNLAFFKQRTEVPPPPLESSGASLITRIELFEKAVEAYKCWSHNREQQQLVMRAFQSHQQKKVEELLAACKDSKKHNSDNEQKEQKEGRQRPDHRNDAGHKEEDVHYEDWTIYYKVGASLIALATVGYKVGVAVAGATGAAGVAGAGAAGAAGTAVAAGSPVAAGAGVVGAAGGAGAGTGALAALAANPLTLPLGFAGLAVMGGYWYMSTRAESYCLHFAFDFNQGASKMDFKPC